MIVINDLTVRFGHKTVYDSFSTELPDHGTVLISGESGIGKTTLLRVLSGTLKPDKGKILGLKGRRISMVYQEPRLLTWMTALSNVSVVSNEEKAISILSRLGMENELNSIVSSLSGGQQQRVSIARAFAYSKDIVLLDEPFNGLDYDNKVNVIKLIKEADLSIIVSHHAEDATLLNIDKKIML